MNVVDACLLERDRELDADRAGADDGDAVHRDGRRLPGMNVNASFAAAFIPAQSTVTVVAPASWDGVLTINVEESANSVDAAGRDPNDTVQPALKFRPRIVTLVPPALGPESGVMLVISGVSATVIGSVSLPPPFVAGRVAVRVAVPARRLVTGIVALPPAGIVTNDGTLTMVGSSTTSDTITSTVSGGSILIDSEATAPGAIVSAAGSNETDGFSFTVTLAMSV